VKHEKRMLARMRGAAEGGTARAYGAVATGRRGIVHPPKTWCFLDSTTRPPQVLHRVGFAFASRACAYLGASALEVRTGYGSDRRKGGAYAGGVRSVNEKRARSVIVKSTGVTRWLGFRARDPASQKKNHQWQTVMEKTRDVAKKSLVHTPFLGFVRRGSTPAFLPPPSHSIERHARFATQIARVRNPPLVCCFTARHANATPSRFGVFFVPPVRTSCSSVGCATQ